MGDDRWAALVDAEIVGGYPTVESAQRLREETLFQRAVQVYDWSLSALGLEAMRVGCAEAFGTVPRRWCGGGGSAPRRWRSPRTRT
jgi:hypothetical protein